MSLKAKVEKLPGYNSLVRPWHFLQALRAEMKNGWPAKKMRVIAVTGTNGKTSTCFMIWKMLNEAGHKAGLLTTVGWSEDGENLHEQIEHMTTESVGILSERMRKVADAGAEFLVLEVTSHALSQSRIFGVPVEVAVFTNLTPEHLDYHKTFENYRKAKLKLFRGAKKGVVNADDPSANWFIEAIKNKHDYSDGDIITYGIEKGDLRATEVELSAGGVEYACSDIMGKEGSAEGKGEKLRIRTRIPGKFNVYNSLAAVGVGEILGLSKDEIERGIYALAEVEGRMTRVDEGQDFEVIVDYAHQPDALEKVFESLGEHKGKVIAVHGGAGRRDHATREPRGEILGRESDIVIITEDDTRDEDPEEIAQMFVEGAVKAGKSLGKDLFVELDRGRAIQKAIDMAEAGDVVLILGKGHEKTILRKEGAVEFRDVEVARRSLVGARK